MLNAKGRLSVCSPRFLYSAFEHEERLGLSLAVFAWAVSGLGVLGGQANFRCAADGAACRRDG